MKRSVELTVLTVTLSLLSLGAISCAVSETGNSNMTATNGNTGANAAANSNVNMITGTSGATADAITAKEKQIWDAIKNKNYDAFGNMLSSDMVYVGTNGMSDKAGTISGLKDLNATEVNLSDWKTVVLDEDAVVVIYTADVKGTSGGKPIPPGAVRNSTAWIKRGAEWVVVYHQECPVEEPPAAPTAETSKPASTAANTNTAGTAATPAGSGAADDLIAKEKLLWDALKRKDWDTFAAALAEDQIEVGPSGVFDKAGTLAAVKTFDFSKASTSDFKATKLDGDATLVTYMVKAPDPSGKLRDERTSTIWVNRDGKWLAVFHHGTPVMQMPSK